MERVVYMREDVYREKKQILRRGETAVLVTPHLVPLLSTSLGDSVSEYYIVRPSTMAQSVAVPKQAVLDVSDSLYRVGVWWCAALPDDLKNTPTFELLQLGLGDRKVVPAERFVGHRSSEHFASLLCCDALWIPDHHGNFRLFRQ